MSDILPKSNGKIRAALAEIAIEYKIITEAQLKQALSDIHLEKLKGRDLSLEDYLLENNMVDRETMTRLLAATLRFLDKKIGAIAIRRNLVTAENVTRALGIQKLEFAKGHLKPVCDILIAGNLLTIQQKNDLFKELDNGIETGSFPGSGKDIKPPPVAPEPDNKRFEKSEKLSLVVSNQDLRADIHIPGNFLNKLDISDIKDLISDHNLRFGIIDDQDIENHLSHAGAEPYSFVVAMGIPSLPARDASVRIYFNNNYLNPGKITEDGSIDFKDRGDVPFVKAGSTLAEKIPGVDGKSGHDVYGNTIPAEKAMDQPFKNGEGTQLSPDGLKIIAAIDGQPMMTVHGEITVMKEIQIPGDVDYTTGNIIFSGNIIVKGSINPGFTIKGGHLTARDANGAVIDVTGNIDISGGIIDSVLSAGGGIQAMYMAGTKADAYGDILIKKEIIDCRIRTSGACSNERVRIISSYVSAKKGIMVRQIGTDVSKPSTLRVGISDHTDKIIKKIRETIEEKKTALEKVQNKNEDMQAAHREIHKKIMEVAQEETRLSLQKKSIEDKLTEMGDLSLLPEKIMAQVNLLRGGLTYCIRAIEKFDVQTKDLFNEQDALTHSIIDYQIQCESLIGEIERLHLTINDIKTWDKKNPPVPQVKVLGEIHPETSVGGPNSMLVTKDTHKNVTIREARQTDDDHYWEMRIDPN